MADSVGKKFDTQGFHSLDPHKKLDPFPGTGNKSTSLLEDLGSQFTTPQHTQQLIPPVTPIPETPMPPSEPSGHQSHKCSYT